MSEEYKFKVGDTVKESDDGETGKIVAFDNERDLYIYQPGSTRDIRLINNREYTDRWYKSRCTLINSKQTIMNLTNRFANLFVGEPEKSQREVGLRDEKGILTDEGSKIYLTYLLNKEKVGEGFDKDVVQPLKAQQEKEEGKK